MLGALTTDDPLDPAVARWWRAKADEIYTLIPDFGGFVVKANSEGQPGPQDYGRTHADGANVLADAVAPHGGIVMWRAFVYDEDVDPDRVKRAYAEFVPLDGQVSRERLRSGQERTARLSAARAVSSAVRRDAEDAADGGAADHAGVSRPVEPPRLPGADVEGVPRRRHVRQGPGSLVAKVIDGSLEGQRRTGIAGVANTGRDVNWSGHDFAQANWYAFGRLAWNPGLSAGAIADEWIRMTWGHAPEVVATIRSIMLDSREAFVHYTMPLGLHHLIGGDHYAPMPENTDPRRAGLVRHLLSPRRRVGHRLRSHAPRQRRRGPVPLAAARAVERSRDHARRTAAVVSPPALGLPHEVGPHALGRAGPRPTAAAPTRRRDSRRGGRRCAARSMRSATRPCSPSCAGRRKMPPRGATSASATSRPSAMDRPSTRSAGAARKDPIMNAPGHEGRKSRGRSAGSLIALMLTGAAVLHSMNLPQQTMGSNARSDADLFKLLDRFADAWNRHDLDALMSMMTDDCVFEASAGPQVDGQRSEGKQAVRAAYAAVFEAFPDAHWANPRHFIAGNRGVSEWTFTGTQKDGKRVEVTGCDLFTFRDGKIAIKNSYRKNRPAI